MSDCLESLFDMDFSVDKPIRLIELFGGIGSQAMALRDIGADFEHYRLIEFDKYACASYNAIHGTSFEPTDIRNVHGGDLGIVDKDDWCYLLTYSFPCTDLSVAGKMEGMSKADWENGKSTRSGLLWEVERILEELPKECLPDILLMENVPQVHAEKNLSDFESWQSFLRGRGYQNFYADLNARDFGIPQNRNRCFMVSILSDEYVDFEFPEKIELETVMKDYLEESVDEKFYINSEKADKLMLKVRKIGNLNPTFESQGRVYDKNGLRPTLRTFQGGGLQPKVIEETKCVGSLTDSLWGGKQPHQQDRVYKGDIALAEPANIPGGSYKYIVAMRSRGENNEQQLELNTQGVNALTTVQKDNLVMEKKGAKQNDEEKRIREILYILREKIGEKTFCEWSIRGLFCILQTEILRQNVYAEELFENWKTATKMEQFTHNGTIDKQFVATTDLVRDLWGVWKTGCSSYRRQFSEQQFIEFKSFVQKLPHEDTQTKIFMFCLWEACEGIGILRKALSEIQEIWKPTSDKQGAWSYRIRKLTPREVWRLMGYTDEDFDKAAKVNSQTQLYKQAGNAIVKQVLMAIFRQLKPKMREQK